MRDTTRAQRVCPAEHAGWLSTPLRRLLTNPDRILRGLVRPGDRVADLGCGPGFFTLPLAEAVGRDGVVIAVDLQTAMLERVREHAVRRALLDRIRLHSCGAESLRLREAGTLDFALAFWMVHEVPDAAGFFGEVSSALRSGGRLLLAEPRGHVGAADWSRTLAAARGAGFIVVDGARVDRRWMISSRVSLLERAL